MTSLALRELAHDYCIVKLDPQAPIPPWLLRAAETDFVSLSRSAAELSVIAPSHLTQALNAGPAQMSAGWRCLEIEFDSDPAAVPGVIDSAVHALAAANLSVFVVSSFDTDHLLVQQLQAAHTALTQAGHRLQLHRPPPPPTEAHSSATLLTQRLQLRALQHDDFEAVARFFAHPASSHYGGPCDRDTAWRKFAAWFGHWTLRGYGPLAIERRDTAEFIGWCGHWYPEGWPEPEITWVVLPEHQRRGFATEAALAVLRYTFEQLRWTTAVSVIDDRNLASCALARRLGALPERAVDLFGQPGTLYRHPPEPRP